MGRPTWFILRRRAESSAERRGAMSRGRAERQRGLAGAAPKGPSTAGKAMGKAMGYDGIEINIVVKEVKEVNGG